MNSSTLTGRAHELAASVLSARQLYPVLVDVGASGATPAVWDPIARQSIYVGFDPDSRDLREIRDGRFHRATIVNEAVTVEPGDGTAKFFLTHSPYCSSTLPPDANGLSGYIFSDLFAVEREVEVRATTLNAVFKRLKLPGIDWLKLDTQGTDLRLYQSLADELRARVLAVDVEPGLIDAYEGEDLFVQAHTALVREGFWLSNLLVQGPPRLSRGALAEALARRPELDEATLANTLKPAPGWCEARYLRSLESLAQHGAGERDYLLLWAFALLDGHSAFAFEAGLVFGRRYSRDAHAASLAAEALRLLPVKPRPGKTARLKALIPGPIKRAVKRVLR